MNLEENGLNDKYLKKMLVVTGGTFCISSYNDGLQVTPVFNDNVLSQKEVDQLSNEIDNEVEELLKFVDDYEV